MEGTGLPLVTPFDESGELNEQKLRHLVDWVTERGVDFIVPCGSNSEAELMSTEERARVVEIVIETADIPVLAGTGHPGLAETQYQTKLAADAGADGALVITPFYYHHEAETLDEYYRHLADDSQIPIYLYSVPKYTNITLDPQTVERLAEHTNIHGIKDSSGNLEILQRERALAPEFKLLVGSGSIYAPGLDVGADGGVLALANVVPKQASELYRLHRAGKDERARHLNRELVALNRAVTARYGVPGLKAAMRVRGAPAGYCRRPLRPVNVDVETELKELVTDFGPGSESMSTPSE